MKTTGIILLILVTFCSMSSCKKKMETTSKSENLSDFDTLTIQSVFNVHLIHTDHQAIEIIGPKKIVNSIEWEIKDNTLFIKNTFKGNWIHPSNNKVTLNISYNNLNRINLYETCKLTTENPLVGEDVGLVMASKLNEADIELNCNTFYFWNNFPCGGKVNLRGQCSNLKLYNFALMAIDASQCQALNSYVANSSKGDVKVNCTNEFKYEIKGEGNIYLRGAPFSIEKIVENSTGKLIIE